MIIALCVLLLIILVEVTIKTDARTPKEQLESSSGALSLAASTGALSFPPEGELSIARLDVLIAPLRSGADYAALSDKYDAYYTPAALAERMKSWLQVKPGHSILEPSAGRGALVPKLGRDLSNRVELRELQPLGVEVRCEDAKALFKRLRAVENDYRLTAAERELQRAKLVVLGELRELLTCEQVRYYERRCVRETYVTDPRVTVHEGDFLALGESWADSESKTFDRIIMNPPFTKQADMRHVAMAVELLAPGGRMVALVSPAYEFRQTSVSKAFKQKLFGDCNLNTDCVENVPAGTFEHTNIETRLLVCTRKESP